MQRFLKNVIGRKCDSTIELMKPRIFETHEIRRHELEKHIKRHIENDQKNPISIFWSPHGTGKTTMIKDIISSYNTTYWTKQYPHIHIPDSIAPDPYLDPVSIIDEKKVKSNEKNIVMMCDITDHQCMMDPEIMSKGMSEENIKKYSHGHKCVFVIDRFDQLFNTIYHNNEIHINTMLENLVQCAEKNKFKIILVSSDPLITMSCLRHGIINMTKDVVENEHSHGIGWSFKIMEQYIDSQIKKIGIDFADSLTDSSYFLIRRLSHFSGNPLFVQNLISSSHNINESDYQSLETLAKFYEEQWNFGYQMISS